MPLPCLRADLPPPSSFSVTQLPHLAKLDQNEAPVDLPAPLKQELAAELAARAWNRYPQPRDYAAAKAGFAAAIGVAPERLALTVGGDQTILGAFLLAGGPGRRARWFEPTYPYIGHAALLTGTTGDPVVLGEEVDRVSAARVIAAPAPDLIVMVAPNNPTGGSPDAAAVAAALADPRRLLFVDEAYADFAGATLLSVERDNLLIGRSLSKALLADVRLGYAVGHPDAIAALERLLVAPYHLNGLQLVVAARWPDLAPHVHASVDAVIAERERVYAALAALPELAPRPSRGNFILFAVAGPAGRAAAVQRALAAAGVRVRDVSGLPGLGHHLRLTIGTAADNDLALAALGAALSASS